VIALSAKQTGRGGQRFPFGIRSFCHTRKYQLQISMSTFIICRMTYIFLLIAALSLLPLPTPGHAQADRIPVSTEEKAMTSLTEEQARAVIAPWYSLFNVASRGDVKAIQEQILTEDYESCAGYLPGECWGREASIKVVSNFANSIPDMKFDIKEVLVAGDRVIVRGEVTGTPSGDLFGVPHSGKSFRIMAVDIQTVRDGKIAKTFHMENWLSAIGQLRAK
jgi:ketosteroid isomerase-like protein